MKTLVLAMLALVGAPTFAATSTDTGMQTFAPKAEAIGTLQPANEFERNAYNDTKLKAVLRDRAKNIAADDQKIADDATVVANQKAKILAQAKALVDAKKKIQAKLAAELAALTAPKKVVPANAKKTDAQKKTEADKAALLEVTIAQKKSKLETARAETDSAQAAMTAAAAEAASAQADRNAKAAVAAASSAKYNVAREDYKKARSVLGSINRAKAEARMNSIYDNTYQLEIAIVSNDQARSAVFSAKRAKIVADANVTTSTQALSDAKLALEAKTAAATKAGLDAQAAQAAKAATAEKLALAQKEANAAKAELDSANAIAAKSAAASKQAAKAIDDAKLKLAVTKKTLAAAAKDKEAKSALVAQAEAALAKALESAAPIQAQAKADAEAAARAKSVSEAKAASLKLAAKADADTLAKKNTADANAAASAKALIQAMQGKSQREAALSKAIAAAAAAGNAREASVQALALNDQALAQVRSKLNSLFVPQREQYQLVFEDIFQAQSDEQKLYSAAVWKNKPEGTEWTKATIAAVRANIDNLERAQDIEDFCPGYNAASTHHREVCWLRLIGALAEKESDLNPNTGFVEPSGNASVGLMALSIKECKNLDTERLVKNPLLNLSCAVGKMGQRIARDGWLAGPDGRRGASAYWSTLREPYEYEHTRPDGTTITYHLGKKPEVSRVTKKYTAF